MGREVPAEGRGIMLEDLFAKHADVLKSPYEVVRTVGFEANSKTGAGEIKPLRFSVKIIRLLGQSDFQAIVGNSNLEKTELGSLIWREEYFPQLSRTDADAALDAILEYLAKWLRSNEAAGAEVQSDPSISPGDKFRV
jgi:hypothetical protein